MPEPPSSCSCTGSGWQMSSRRHGECVGGAERSQAEAQHPASSSNGCPFGFQPTRCTLRKHRLSLSLSLCVCVCVFPPEKNIANVHRGKAIASVHQSVQGDSEAPGSARSREKHTHTHTSSHGTLHTLTHTWWGREREREREREEKKHWVACSLLCPCNFHLAFWWWMTGPCSSPRARAPSRCVGGGGVGWGWGTHGREDEHICAFTQMSDCSSPSEVTLAVGRRWRRRRRRGLLCKQSTYLTLGLSSGPARFLNRSDMS